MERCLARGKCRGATCGSDPCCLRPVKTICAGAHFRVCLTSLPWRDAILPVRVTKYRSRVPAPRHMGGRGTGRSPAVLLAGGVGITPLKGIAEYAADKALPVPIRLIYSNRSEDEIVYRRELEALETLNPRFRMLNTLTRTTDRGWKGATGRIDSKLLREAARDLADPIYYVSGTPSMVVGILRLLRGLDVPDSNIEVEAFRGYE